MNWKPIPLEKMQKMLAQELASCTDEQRAYLQRVALPAPQKWQLTPWGDLGGGFWAVAVQRDRVLWYNDIEDGFNVSCFVQRGVIPTAEYRCNDEDVQQALLRLAGETGHSLGPAQSP
jgi:hypothetical protein